MKKLISIILVAVIMLLNTAQLNAATAQKPTPLKEIPNNKLIYNSKLLASNISTAQASGIVLVHLRTAFELLGGNTVWDVKSGLMSISYNGTAIKVYSNKNDCLINGRTVHLSTPAKLVNSKLMAPLGEMLTELNMILSCDSKGKVLSISNGSLLNYNLVRENTADKLKLNFVNFKTYTITAVNPLRVNLVIPNMNLANTIKDKIYESKLIKAVSFVKSGKNVSVQIDLKKNLTPLAIKDSSSLTLSFNDMDEDSEELSGELTGEVYGDIKAVMFDEDYVERISIPVKNNDKYFITRLTSPDRIQVDMSNTRSCYDKQTYDLAGDYVGTMEIKPLYSNVLRMTISLKGQENFEVTRDDKNYLISVTDPGYKGLKYTRLGDRVTFTLDKLKLTDSEENIINLYSEEYDETRKQYTLSFSNDIGDLGQGVMYINDDLFASVSVKKDEETNTTNIIFSAKAEFLYHVITRYDKNKNCMDTAVTVLKPIHPGERLVVIDAGHGGYDPGTQPSKDFPEKNLNLDIALRVNSILKSRNVKTYMIREQDIYVDLYERAYIANMLEASLFVSIHNNANDGLSNGTEALYFPNGPKIGNVDSMELANNIQFSLINALGIKNNGLISRPGLCVLRKTDMPSVISEVAYMDNKENAALLKTESFKQKAAQAISDAIIETLAELDPIEQESIKPEPTAPTTPAPSTTAPTPTTPAPTAPESATQAPTTPDSN